MYLILNFRLELSLWFQILSYNKSVHNRSICFANFLRTSSEAAPNAKAEEVARALGLSGVLLPCDGGGMWVMQGDPFCNAMADEDNAVKRRIINLTIEYMTSY